MSKLLSGVMLRSHAVALGAALGSLLAAAGRDLPQSYVMGASGHAFRLTLDLVISPDSPVTLNFHDVLPLWENLGVWLKRVATTPDEPAFATIRAEVIERIKAAVDRGLPAVSYDLLACEEYGLVVGYDETRFACLTQTNPTEPEWMEVAAWPPAAHESFTRADAITVLDVASSFERRRADVAALRFAVDHYWEGTSPDMWLQNGGKAYEFWSRTLEAPLPLHGDDPGRGHAYNLAVLHGARADAAAYLADCAAAYPEAPSLKAAAEAYADVVVRLAEGLKALAGVPGRDLSGNREARTALARSLSAAKVAEERGIESIERALRALR